MATVYYTLRQKDQWHDSVDEVLGKVPRDIFSMVCLACVREQTIEWVAEVFCYNLIDYSFIFLYLYKWLAILWRILSMEVKCLEKSILFRK